MERICEDNSTIKALWFPDESNFSIGVNGVEKITAYQETGDMAYVTWFTISSQGQIISRVNAAHVQTIQYERDSSR